MPESEERVRNRYHPWVILLLCGALLCSILGCDLTTLNGNQSSSTPIASTVAVVNTRSPSGTDNSSALGLPNWLQVYFTNPNPPDNLGHGIDQNVLPVLENATQSIDLVSFDLNLPDVIHALVAASQRGVKVRVVFDGTNGNLDLNNAATNDEDFDTIATLKKAKISMVNGGRNNGLMHDKILIVDDKVLFMGSMNYSYNDVYRNNNNLLEITEPHLIANYQAKFNELFVEKRFGTQALVQVPYPTLDIDGIQVENYFAPEDGVMDKIIALVNGATKTVHFMVYTYTDKDLATAMIAQSKHGLEVQGVIESRDSSQGALPTLYCSGLPVKVDGNPYTMHHKVIILDGKIVITGSFNFTKSADMVNDENVLVIHSAAVAQVFEQEFQRVYQAGKKPDASALKCSH